MKKSIVYFSIIFLFLMSHMFSQSASIEKQVNLSYQIIRISEKADERVVIINNSGRSDAFQIYIHLEEYGYAANKNPFASAEKIMEDENWLLFVLLQNYMMGECIKLLKLIIRVWYMQQIILQFALSQGKNILSNLKLNPDVFFLLNIYVRKYQVLFRF